jgi:hypothetical protein
MDRWETALLVIAGYVAVTNLVRLMLHHRDQMLNAFRDRMKAARQRKKATEDKDQYDRPSKAA